MDIKMHLRAIKESIEEIEDSRNKLCYGRERTEDDIKEVINLFFKLKGLFSEGGYDGL